MTTPDLEEYPFRIAALYKFVQLDDYEEMQAPIRSVCAENGVMGTLLLAREGINGTIAGPPSGIKNVLTYLKSDPCLADLDHKESGSNESPFHRLKVRLKKEIVTLGAGELNPAENAGTHVDPKDWNALISDPEVLVVDTRNDYEVAIGSFDGAVNPKTKSFRELVDWVDKEVDPKQQKKVAMFCTGGIRCEKSTALLKSRGVDEVYHLRGGILKYLEEVEQDDSLWHGQCYVFDHRVSVGHGLVPGEYEKCHACRHPISQEDKQLPTYQEGVSCRHCYGEISEAQERRFRDRQKQMRLAEQRGEKHIATDVKELKRAKEAEAKFHALRSRGEEIPETPTAASIENGEPEPPK